MRLLNQQGNNDISIQFRLQIVPKFDFLMQCLNLLLNAFDFLC